MTGTDTPAIVARIVAMRATGATWRRIGTVVAGEFGGSDKPERVRRIYRDHRERLEGDGGAPPASEEEEISAALDAQTVAAKESARKRVADGMVRRLIHERAVKEMLAEAIRDSVQSLPPMVLPPIRRVNSRFAEEEAVLVISDSQIGEHISLEESGGLGEYSLEIFRRRARNLTRAVREIRSIHAHALNIRRLHIAFIGDIVDNEVIFPGHKDHIETDVVSQVFEATREFVPMLLELQQDFEEINCVGLIGNHGRTGRKGESKTWVSFDYLTYKFLEAYTANQPRIKWTIPKAWFHVLPVAGHNLLLVHGDDVKAWMGIPFYGLQRADGRYTKLLGSRVISYETMIVGHFHNPAQMDSVGGEILVNGAWPGVSMFGLKTLNTASVPSQWFFGVSPKRGISWRYKVLLDEPMAAEIGA